MPVTVHLSVSKENSQNSTVECVHKNWRAHSVAAATGITKFAWLCPDVATNP